MFISITCLEFSYHKAEEDEIVCHGLFFIERIAQTLWWPGELLIQNPTLSFEADKAAHTIELTVSTAHTVKTVEDIEVVTQVQLEALEASDVETRKAKGVTNPAVVDAGRDAAIKPGTAINFFASPDRGDKGTTAYAWQLKQKPAASRSTSRPKTEDTPPSHRTWYPCLGNCLHRRRHKSERYVTLQATEDNLPPIAMLKS